MSKTILLYKDIAPGADTDAAVSAPSSQDFTDPTQLPFGTSEAPALTCELNQWGLDGTFILTEEVEPAFWSSEMSGADGSFASGREPVITIVFDEQYSSMVYKLIQPHDATDNPDWTPPATPAMWAAVSKEGEDGTLENPITAARGMEYVYGKYYRDPEDGKLYLCKRTGEEEGGKVTLQFLPHELVAQYFEEVQG